MGFGFETESPCTAPAAGTRSGNGSPCGMMAMGIVPTIDRVEDYHPCLDLALEAAVVGQLAFQGGEETLAHRFVETVADRTHQGSHALPLGSAAQR